MGEQLFMVVLLLLLLAAAQALPEHKALDAVVQTTDKLVHQLGWKKEEVSISRVDTRDAQLGEALIYEFDIEIGGSIFPIKLAEEITAWRYMQELLQSEEEGTGVVELSRPNLDVAVLPPFQLAGPVELWIQDAKHLRLAVPHDVDAGVLNRVLLADGATVTVTGAREVSLARPFKLPLPLVGSTDDSSLAASLLALAAQLKYASRSNEKPLLSLRIVGPTSLVAASPPKHLESPGKWKVKRLAPGAVELVNKAQQEFIEEDHQVLLDITSDSWLWPLPSVNGSDAKLRGLEQALRVFLGPNAYKKGSFNLLRAKAAAASFLKIEFELEKKVGNDSFLHSATWPEWATKPSLQRFQFEVLAKVEGDKVLPVTVRPVETFSPAIPSIDLTANATFSKSPQFFPPVSPMTLNVDWDGVWLQQA